MDSIKIPPAIANQGIILDATASRAIGNGTIIETAWDFGNGNKISYRGSPVIERQIYATQNTFPVKLTIKTNDNQTFSKEIQLLVRDPAAVIKVDDTVTNVGINKSFAVESYFGDARNIEYSWSIQDESGNRSIRSANGPTLSYTFTEIGSYIVTLNARSPNGGTDSDSVVIKVESREPIATLDPPKPISSERPNTFVFDASKSFDPDTNSRQNLTYTWRLNGQAINLDDPSANGAK